MTLIRCMGSAALVALLTTTLFALQNEQQARKADDKGCNSLRVIQVQLGSEELTKANTIPDDDPVRVCTHDMVAWHFINTSDQPVKINLEGFRRCGTNQAVKPIKFRGGWFDDDSDATVAPGRSVTMMGRVTMPGGPNGTCVKYDVDVRQRGHARIKHDPRLEIVDP